MGVEENAHSDCCLFLYPHGHSITPLIGSLCPESANIRHMSESLPINNIAKLLERVRLSAEKSQRAQSDIIVLAVSKTRSAKEIRAAYSASFEHFGENYLQEALQKIESLEDLDILWHFIGPIQSNKTRAIAEHFQWVQSVDRVKIARRLSGQRPSGLPPLNICLQVNISGEESKSGVQPQDISALAKAVDELPGLQLRGLMAIPAATSDEEQQRQVFARLRHLFEELKSQHPQVDTLSMGMSGDMEAAITEGATMVRIGTALFGPRGG